MAPYLIPLVLLDICSRLLKRWRNTAIARCFTKCAWFGVEKQFSCLERLFSSAFPARIHGHKIWKKHQEVQRLLNNISPHVRWFFGTCHGHIFNYSLSMVALFLQTFCHCAATHGETHFEGFSRFEGSGSSVSSGLRTWKPHDSPLLYCCLSSVFFLVRILSLQTALWKIVVPDGLVGTMTSSFDMFWLFCQNTIIIVNCFPRRR